MNGLRDAHRLTVMFAVALPCRNELPEAHGSLRFGERSELLPNMPVCEKEEQEKRS